MAAERRVNVNNVVQTIVQHASFRETINSVLTATNEEQSNNIVDVETNQINTNNLINTPSAGSTSNSRRIVTRTG